MVHLNRDYLDDPWVLRKGDIDIAALDPADFIASPGDIGISVTEACCPPKSPNDWLNHVLLCVQKDDIPADHFRSNDEYWLRKISWIRYKYLISLIPPHQQPIIQPPSDPLLAKLWRARRRHYDAYVKAHRKYLEAVEKEVLRTSKNREELERKSKRGRVGNPSLRNSIADLLDVYGEIFDRLPTYTRGGSFVRFAIAALEGIPIDVRFQINDRIDFRDRNLMLHSAVELPALRPLLPGPIRDLAKQMLNRSDALQNQYGQKARPSNAFQMSTPAAVKAAFFSALDGEKWAVNGANFPAFFRIPFEDEAP